MCSIDLYEESKLSGCHRHTGVNTVSTHRNSVAVIVTRMSSRSLRIKTPWLPSPQGCQHHPKPRTYSDEFIRSYIACLISSASSSNVFPATVATLAALLAAVSARRRFASTDAVDALRECLDRDLRRGRVGRRCEICRRGEFGRRCEIPDATSACASLAKPCAVIKLEEGLDDGVGDGFGAATSSTIASASLASTRSMAQS